MMLLLESDKIFYQVESHSVADKNLFYLLLMLQIIINIFKNMKIQLYQKNIY